MKVVVKEKHTGVVTPIKRGNIVKTPAGNVILVTDEPGFASGKYGGICLVSEGVLKVGEVSRGLNTDGVELFNGTLTISNGEDDAS
ncbi:MAG: hypothetical protein [Bacteriophage sp.]|nr:MAG: hypothetical protein [Bacteriophage sp.]